VLAALAALALAMPAAAHAQVPSGLVINEIDYDQPSTDTAEFLEIRNNSTAPVQLDSFALRWVNGSNDTVYRTNDLPDFSLPAGGYFVVCGEPANVPNCDFDAGAATDLIQNGAPDAVALVNGDTIVDTVSYEGEVPGYTEGAAGAPTDPGTTGSDGLGIARMPDGCDTDQNALDFQVAAITPGAGNGGIPCGGSGDAPPSVADSDPGNGDAGVDPNSNITVTFSEPVTAAPTAFELTCNGATIDTTVTRQDATTYVLDPHEPLPEGSSCTLRVEGDDYTDDDTDDPPDTGIDLSATFTTRALAGLRIHDIQGRQHLSPYRGFLVADVPGIVTATRFNGFYIQDPRPDRDPRTSEGVFIFTGSNSPSIQPVGTAVTVSGQVSEFRSGCTPSCTAPDFPNGEFGSSAYANLTVTEIERATVTPTGTGTIAPTVVGRGGREIPRTVIDDDTADPLRDDPPLISGDVESKSSAPGDTVHQDPTFDPWEDGIDFYESLEGMLTRVNRAVVIEPSNVFSAGAANENTEIAVLADDGKDASVRAKRGPIVVRAFDRPFPHEYRYGDFNPERIILNDPVARDNDLEPAPDDAEVGDRFTGPIDAVVDYSFGNYKFLGRAFPPLAKGKLKPEVAKPAKRDELSIASYNVENLDPVNDAERIVRIASQIRENLRAPDILGVEEVQDNDGEGPGGPNGDATWQALVAALAADGGPVYDYRQIDPVDDEDGGAPNANIRVGFLFRPDRVSFVDRPGGTAVNATEDDPAQPGAQLTFSPGRIDPTNPVWEDSRKPLAGEFRYRGRTLFVVANHFASKGGDAPTFGRFQEPYRPSELQRRGATQPTLDPQRGQAGVVNAWVHRLLAADHSARVIVLGDLNDFDFSETIKVLERGAPDSFPELIDLWRLLPQDEHYSYIFQGNAQVLDHILVSPSLLFAWPDFGPVHINSEFSEEQQSDHDPPLLRLALDCGHGHDHGHHHGHGHHHHHGHR
jgi:endonuclease/exonuclease/phosphatase family metal-dependent hydrolase